MKKKVLMMATIASTIGQFNVENIRILQSLGYEVHVAADLKDYGAWPRERVEKFVKDMAGMNVPCHQIDFSRSPLRIDRHSKSYQQLKQLLADQHYSFIHTHTPIASAVGRLAAKSTGTKVIYTAHGFHFYTGAPLKNWIIFYPVEKWLSKYTDVLITINQEDYTRAQKKFHAKRTVYIPGTGVDTSKFIPGGTGRERIRKELGLSDDRVLLLSVGELNENKNHSSVIRAVQGMNLTYTIVGKGEKKAELEQLGKDLGVDVRLTGFRNDVADFYKAADVFVLPSLREGLNVSLMEAMASGLACACGKIRGNTDLIEEPLFKPTDPDDIRTAISLAISQREKLGQINLEKIKKFDVKTVGNLISEIYREL